MIRSVCSIGVIRSSSPPITTTGSWLSVERVVLVQLRERRVEVGDHLHRGLGEHLADELDVAGRHVGAEGHPPGHHEAEVAAGLPASARPARGSGSARPSSARRSGRRPARECPRIGEWSAISPAAVWSRATPRIRVPNSSGRVCASRMIVMPPIEWPTSTTGPVTDHLVQHLHQVIGQLRQPAVLRRRPAGATVGPLVVEDLPDLPAEVLALEVPAVQVQRVAVHQDQGEVVGRALVHLGVQHHAVGRGDRGTVGAEREELLELGLAAPVDPLADQPPLQLEAERPRRPWPGRPRRPPARRPRPAGSGRPSAGLAAGVRGRPAAPGRRSG